MKKLATLFSDSYHELRKVSTLTAAALFGAVSIVLGYFTLVIGNYLKIGFSTLPAQVVYYLFGPVVGACFGGSMDILKYLVKPTGPFFPGFTLSAVAAGILYGIFYYKKPLSIIRVFTAELTVSVICNMLLGTLWLTILHGKGFLAILPPRIVKNLIMWPINSLLFFAIAKVMEISGIFRVLNTGKTRYKEIVREEKL